MSYKRQLQAHYRNLLNAILTITVPEWVSGRAMRASLLGVVVVMSVAYMIRINSAATRGYEAHNLEKQVAQMSVDLQNLQIKIADAGSMSNIEKKLADVNMIAVEDFQRYNTTGGVVAMAK